MSVRYLIFLTFIGSFIVSAESQTVKIYKWIDNEGILHYSQFPPQDNIVNSKVTTEEVPKSVLSSKPLDYKQWTDDIEKYLVDKKRLRANTAAKVEIKKERRKNCEITRKNLQLYKANRRIRVTNGNHQEIRKLSDDERVEKIRGAEEYIKTNC